MDPEDLISFDKLITPQYVRVLFWIGVAASVLVGLGMILTGGAGVPFGLAVLVGGPVLTRVGCELLVLAFKVVDWIAEIKITLAEQQEGQAANQPTVHRGEDSSSSSPAKETSSTPTAPPSSQ
jgi:hypothetical protein